MMNFVLLQAAGGASPITNILMIVAMVGVVYFLMIRPQQKRQKELEKSRAEMKKGDKVITSGGIHAEIKEVRDDSFVLEIAPEVRIRVDRNSVFANQPNTESK